MNFLAMSILLVPVSLSLPALHSTAKLPNDDRMIVGACMGYWINPLLIQVPKTIAEVVGTFCNDFEVNVKKVEHAIEKYNEADEKLNLLYEIKRCVALVPGKSSTSGEDLIRKYSEFSEKNAPSSFRVFAQGFCKTPELVEFEDLNEEERPTSLSCFEDCIKTFFTEIQDELNAGMQMLKATQGTGVEFKIEVTDELKSKMQTPIDELEQSTIELPNMDKWEQSNEDITAKTKYWLEKYNKYYKAFNRRASSIHRIQMDGNLSDAYFVYQSCIKWECAMKNHADAPYAAWLSEQVKQSQERDLYTALSTGPEFYTFSHSDLIQNKRFLEPVAVVVQDSKTSE